MNSSARGCSSHSAGPNPEDGIGVSCIKSSSLQSVRWPSAGGCVTGTTPTSSSSSSSAKSDSVTSRICKLTLSVLTPARIPRRRRTLLLSTRGESSLVCLIRDGPASLPSHGRIQRPISSPPRPKSQPRQDSTSVKHANLFSASAEVPATAGFNFCQTRQSSLGRSPSHGRIQLLSNTTISSQPRLKSQPRPDSTPVTTHALSHFSLSHGQSLSPGRDSLKPKSLARRPSANLSSRAALKSWIEFGGARSDHH